MGMDRTERLRLAQQLLQSEGWGFLRDELEKQITGKAREIDSLQACGSINESQYQAGVKRGLDIALSLPYTIAKKESSYLERIKEFVGVNPG